MTTMLSPAVGDSLPEFSRKTDFTTGTVTPP